MSCSSRGLTLGASVGAAGVCSGPLRSPPASRRPTPGGRHSSSRGSCSRAALSKAATFGSLSIGSSSLAGSKGKKSTSSSPTAAAAAACCYNSQRYQTTTLTTPVRGRGRTQVARTAASQQTTSEEDTNELSNGNGSSSSPSTSPSEEEEAAAFSQTRNLDEPTEGFDAIEECIAEIADGRFVVVLDDEDRENEGDLIMAAELCTTEQMAFLVNNTSGLACVAMCPDECDRLRLPLMVASQENDESMSTAFTTTVDLRQGTTTGISASDRAATTRALANPNSIPEDFARPGHILPLRARRGGVLKRPGHTEAAVDLTKLAKCSAAGLICEIIDRDTGLCMKRDALLAFAKENNLKVCTIADLVRYQRKRANLIAHVATANLPTKFGEFVSHTFRDLENDGIEHVAIVKGDITSENGAHVLCRVHSECLTGDIFGSLRCDCGPQLDLALERLQETGRGVVIYLRGHEGRGIGLGAKIKAYQLQDEGMDTVDANLHQGLPADARDYGAGAQMLANLGVTSVCLMTNNPEKTTALSGYGIEVSDRVPMVTLVNPFNKKYLETKRRRMGHIYSSENNS
ncbi:hypothetical protein PPROV_000830800 [Pycnococcus provasolii]|uniref:GTP cyclohydrolase II domain-containing protein n=1 Tax=Pycnococcus provasolii TaxID=41880 RepID=A0A830HSB6_9CHLO|nr:hypothetical protein PPROV_000830800 [Pycnococcus provasolii]